MSLINELANRLNKLEALLGGDFNNQKIARTNEQDGSKKLKQSSAAFGIYTALCVGTEDQLRQNRIKIFCPLFHGTDTGVGSLPYAYPISSLGGFDDSGLSWVPPAGSTVIFSFEGGNRSVPYYFGTTWSRDRGADGQHTFSISIPEYQQLYEGRRRGYLVGKNDGSQVLPPWNTESYNAFDFNKPSSDAPTTTKTTATYPNIYGFKTPEKHMMKMVDGDGKCNRKWKRLEIMSGCGNWLIMKDDHLHVGGQWAHPSCTGTKGTTDCLTPKQANNCAVYSSNSKALGVSASSGPIQKPIGAANPFYKQASECRPYSGPGTPQNNKCDLPQTGVQILSISGHTMVMDDSVEAPVGPIAWERSTQPFNFGCTNKYLGKIYWKSATGHVIELNDSEKQSNIRGINNGVRLTSALGNQIFLCDDTETGEGQKKIATANQGITLRSTSRHEIVMSDGGNDRPIYNRRDGNARVSKATKGFLRIRSGYGLTLLFSDTDSQEKTAQQRITLVAPQKTNSDNKGPHYLIMQEKASGAGQVILRAGGNLILAASDSISQIIGSAKSPANQVTNVTKNSYYLVKGLQYQQNEKFLNVSDDRAYILAGKDYEQKKDPNSTKPKEKAPGVFPVIVFAGGKLKISDRVYASCSNNAAVASIYNLRPNIGIGQKGVLVAK